MQASEDFQKRILVVEDEGLIATDLARRIARLGYPKPDIAQTGEEALNSARSTQFDLVLMDIRLKGELDGVATAAALRSELRTPVVYVTAHADQATIERAKFTEPLGYILKPVSDGDLRSVIQTAIYKAGMERRLRAGAAWLATTLRSVGDGIMATNSDGEVAFMNPSAERLTGWSDGQARGQELMDILRLYDETTGKPASNPVFELAERETRSYMLVSQLGARTAVEVECFENRAADEVLGSIIVARDIGHRRELEARLLQSQRMDAIATMAGGLAHDFNNQLLVISGYAEELGTRLSGDGLEQLAEIRKAASLAAATTTQLLALSRHGGEGFEVLNIHEVIQHVRHRVIQTLGTTATLTTQLAFPLGYIRGDRSQLRQLLLNLALYARDDMPSGGEMRIESSTVEIAAGDALAREYRPGTFMKLLVSDNGQGMDAAALARIFEPRFDARDARDARKDQSGNGLGLSLVHGIVVESGGYIAAQSAVGKGTSFQILWPCVGTYHGNGLTGASTILLVEDEDGVRRLMHRLLEREGYQLLSARNAEDAEQIAGVYQDDIHLLVTDVVMPGITGPQLADRLKPLHPSMKVLFVSGYRHDALGQKGLLGPGVQVLAKPFASAQFLRQVQMLLKQARARLI
jgi:two-component system, cell cycle sensor histidine kinase and response regulator CckA